MFWTESRVEVGNTSASRLWKGLSEAANCDRQTYDITYSNSRNDSNREFLRLIWDGSGSWSSHIQNRFLNFYEIKSLSFCFHIKKLM